MTGGFGFIGSHLVEALLRAPDVTVHVVDSLVTSPIDVDAFVAHLKERDRLTYDICTIAEFFSKVEIPTFDAIYHLASVVGPVGVLGHAGRIIQSVVEDTYRVAEYAARVGARLCDVSTSEVYGGGRDGYCSERDAMIIPPQISVRLEYAVAKLACEVALINKTRASELDAVIVRPFNVAGPRQSTRGGFVLPRFIKQALASEPITVYGDGTMVRAFTHVRDLVDGVVRVMRNGRVGEFYNVGNPANKTTILDLARTVVKDVASNSDIIFVDPKTLWGPLFEEANDKYPDADRAMRELDWQPRYGIEEIVRDTVEYIREGRCD